MENKFSLPSLQARLDRLPVAKSLAVANKQVEHLFGVNDVSAARLNRFAHGHDCIVTHADDCVVFLKVRAHVKWPTSD